MNGTEPGGFHVSKVKTGFNITLFTLANFKHWYHALFLMYTAKPRFETFIIEASSCLTTRLYTETTYDNYHVTEFMFLAKSSSCFIWKIENWAYNTSILFAKF